MTVETNVRKMFSMENPIEIKFNGEIDCLPESNTVYIDAKTTHKAKIAIAEHLIESATKISRKRRSEIIEAEFANLEAEEPKQ